MPLFQKGPWEIDQWGNLIDADDQLIAVRGTGEANHYNEATANANRALIVQAPSLNTVVGKVIDVMENPYSNDAERVAQLFDLLKEMKTAYVPENPYKNSNEHFEQLINLLDNK